MGRRENRNVPSRSLTRLFASAAIATTIAVCGCGSGGSTGVAVNVAGSVISLRTLEHWAHIEAVVSHEFIPRKAPPIGAVPDPPKFAKCIAYLQRVLAPKSGEAALTTQQLRARCAAYLHDLQAHVLEILIDYRWSSEAGKERGISLTTPEINAVLMNLYSNEENLRKLFSFSGETRADQRLLAERNLFVRKLLELEEAEVDAKHPASKKQREQQLIARATAFTKKWMSRTDCSPGYVMELCKQYKGPFSLSLTLP